MGIKDVVRFLICLLNVLIYLGLLCIYGDEVTINFEAIHNSIYFCDWFKYPLGTQRFIPFMLAVAQKPVSIQGFMNFRYSRESVKMVFSIILLLFLFYNSLLSIQHFSP